MSLNQESRWRIVEGDGPLIAVANHAGHELRPEAAALTALSDAERLREEDPYTDAWTTLAPTRVVATMSRFEVDLNRARHEAFYRNPADAWGLNLWKTPPDDDFVARSLEIYDRFYRELHRLCTAKVEQHGKFVVLDLHSYNHRRDGPRAPPADPAGNPDVNLGTGTMDRGRWGTLVDRFVADLSAADYLGGNLDVRENIKFKGRGFPIWVHTTFPETGCVLAVEFKKIFMDEWTGEVAADAHEAIRQALQSCIPGLLESLASLGAHR